MKSFTAELQEEGTYLLYIYSPFCGTCHVARSILNSIEQIHGTMLFAELNAAVHPEFMQQYEIESVPCLFIMKNHEVKEKVYTFHSVAHMYTYVHMHFPEYF